VQLSPLPFGFVDLSCFAYSHPLLSPGSVTKDDASVEPAVVAIALNLELCCTSQFCLILLHSCASTRTIFTHTMSFFRIWKRHTQRDEFQLFPISPRMASCPCPRIEQYSRGRSSIFPRPWWSISWFFVDAKFLVVHHAHSLEEPLCWMKRLVPILVNTMNLIPRLLF
jgi:hypothetical protein